MMKPFTIHICTFVVSYCIQTKSNYIQFCYRFCCSLAWQDVLPSVQPDPKLVAQLAQALGNVTVIHKGKAMLL